jgi:hypothetical protein
MRAQFTLVFTIVATGMACMPGTHDAHPPDGSSLDATRTDAGRAAASDVGDAWVSPPGSGGIVGTSSLDATADSVAVVDVPASVDEASPVLPDARGGDAPPVVIPPPDATMAATVGVFVAQGMQGRTTISCDDGQTWVANESDGDEPRCDVGIDCDHSSGSGRGITFGNGWFVATFGWGPLGAIRRSRDGVNWTAVTHDTTFGGIAFGQNHFLAGHNPASISDPLGDNWAPAPGPQFEGSARRTAFLAHEGGRFIISAGGGAVQELLLSSDAGNTWWRPASRPDTCFADMVAGGIKYGNGVMLLVHPSGIACRSTDGGMNWTTAPMPGNVVARLLYANNEFITWGDQGVYRSRDGQTWRAEATVPANLPLGAVGVNDTGDAFVAARVYPYYEQQKFYRSRDGTHWDTLASDRYVAGHPIMDFAFGRIVRPTQCP